MLSASSASTVGLVRVENRSLPPEERNEVDRMRERNARFGGVLHYRLTRRNLSYPCAAVIGALTTDAEAGKGSSGMPSHDSGRSTRDTSASPSNFESDDTFGRSDDEGGSRTDRASGSSFGTRIRAVK